MANLDGTTVLVTGGAKRVGRAIVWELAKAGCDVAVHYHRSATEAQQVAQQVAHLGRRAVTVSGDLSNPSSWPLIIEQTVDGLDGLDVLVNNASLFLSERADTIDAFDPSHWERMLRINLVAPTALCHHARPHLSAGGRGRIVNLCDVSSRSPHPEHLAYAVSKAALAALTRGLARALAPDVLVNAVAPGIALFPEGYSERLREQLRAKVPLRREGSADEVARWVRFLIESGDYVTGEIISIDGGRRLV